MIWSVSDSYNFRSCPRKWFFQKTFANARAKSPDRHLAYRLSKLISVSAWRGLIVDAVLSKSLLNGLRYNRVPSKEQLQNEAIHQFEKQLKFGMKNDPLSPTTNLKDSDFVAFHAKVYDRSIRTDQLDQARMEVLQAIENLYSQEALLQKLAQADGLFAQRILQFPFFENTVRAIPDVLAFYNNRAPLIVDWKVHTFALQEAWLQLGVYALALKRCRPHSYFPSLDRWAETDVELAEVQLLTNTLREYQLTEEDIHKLEDYIGKNINDMVSSVDNNKPSDLKPEDFDVTFYPGTCQRCKFKMICWEDNYERP